MTALIAAMNKRAVAMAADSAITIDSSTGHKVLNSANKLFYISHSHPVGIMTCGNAFYMGLPWEVIIKEFRKELGSRTLSTLQDYKVEFLNFIINHNHFCTREWQKKTLFNEFQRLYNILASESDSKVTDAEKIECFEHALDDFISKASSPLECFDSYSFECFITDWKSELIAFISKLPIVKISPQIVDKLLKSFYTFIVSRNSVFGTSYTQLIFAGYGESEIMPHLKSIIVWNGIGNIVRYQNYIDQDVTEANDACISRYAQTDIINTFINGIHPRLQKSIDEIVPDMLNKLLEQLASEFDDEADKNKIKNYDTSRTSSLFKDLLDRRSREQFVNPLIDTVGILDVNDLALFTESLISLTSLNRRMLGMEEGVGGPVDTAIITKADGFKWIKCKS